jgi:thiol-disulfide isomerase/thioredoxin
MNTEYDLTLSPENARNSGRNANVEKDRIGDTEVAPLCCQSHIGAISPPGGRNSKDAGRHYRFERLSLPVVLKDLRFSKADPGPGDRVPEFDLPVVGGGRFRSSDLSETGPVLLVFGSSTCPVTDNAAPGLNELHARFGSHVRFVMVNVREAHPGHTFPQPTTLNAKMAHAEKLCILHGFKFELAVDDVDGTLHRALSPKPNSAYILGTDGTIRFRAQWANDTKALASALEAIVAGQSPRRLRSGGVIRPILRMLPNLAPVLDRAGRGAWADMWRVAPPFAAIALVFKVLRLVRRRN